MERYSGKTFVIRLDGSVKTIWVARRYLGEPWLPYKEKCQLLDEVKVTADRRTGEIIQVEGKNFYDPSRVDYFEDHLDGVLPGLCGHGEIMAQTSAAGAMLADSSSSTKFVLWS